MQQSANETYRHRLSRSYFIQSVHRPLTLGYRLPDVNAGRWRRYIDSLEYQFLTHYFSRPPPWRMFMRKFGGRRTLPDFCIIGPIKSGTSDLGVSIMLHPNVMPPLAKEFALPHPESWRIFYPTEKQKQLHAQRHGLALSPFFAPYLHWMELTHNLAQARPNTKIVLTLRNPVERFYSHWKWEKYLSGRARAERLPFVATFPAFVDRALQVYPEYPMYSACGFPALQTSIYWKAVSYWIKCFGRDNVKVLNVDEYFTDRDAVMRGIQEFVGLPYAPTPASGASVNENPLRLPPADEDSKARLRAFFQPHNEKLWEAIGTRFDW